MKKVVLRIDENEQYGFVLIGIVCQHRDYRLCREINLALDISLARDNDFEVFTKKRMEAMTFTRFSFINEEEDEYCDEDCELYEGVDEDVDVDESSNQPFDSSFIAMGKSLLGGSSAETPTKKKNNKKQPKKSKKSNNEQDEENEIDLNPKQHQHSFENPKKLEIILI
jgi:hypothetical protein